MKKGTYVRLLKLIASPDYVPDSTGAEHDLRINPKATVTPDYWLEGFLAEDIALARPIRFTKHIRNGKQVCDAFSTSPVCIVRGNEVWTQMSVFRVLKVPPFDPDKSLQAWL
jgi:hypothetical protein